MRWATRQLRTRSPGRCGRHAVIMSLPAGIRCAVCAHGFTADFWSLYSAQSFRDIDAYLIDAQPSMFQDAGIEEDREDVRRLLNLNTATHCACLLDLERNRLQNQLL